MRQIIKSPEPTRFKQWKDDFRATKGQDATYDDLVLENDEYRALKRSLLQEQGYICCYCERAIGRRADLKDCDIEHFMPRHPDRKALSSSECSICETSQLSYNNLFASCKGELADCADHCNHKKDNWFDFTECVSPADARIKGAFGFGLNGEIYVINPNVREMAKHLNLTSYILEEQRKAALDAVLEIDFDDEDLFENKEYVKTVIEDYDNMQDGRFTAFCSMITFCLQKYYL